jgi:hypothetical protein
MHTKKGQPMSATRQDPRILEEIAAVGESSHTMAVGGYCLWEFQDQVWNLKKQSCGEDFAPGAPPADPGRFDGDIVKKYCELSHGFAANAANATS